MGVWLVVKVDFMSDVFQFGDFEPPKILGRISIKYSKISYFNRNIIIFNSWYSRIFTCTDRVGGREVKLAPKNAKETAFESSQLWIFKQPQTMVTYFGGRSSRSGMTPSGITHPQWRRLFFHPVVGWERLHPGDGGGLLGPCRGPWRVNMEMWKSHGFWMGNWSTFMAIHGGLRHVKNTFQTVDRR